MPTNTSCRRPFSAALAVLAGLVISADHVQAAKSESPQRRAVEQLYASDSPFNQKIPAGAKIDARSAQMVNSVVEVERKQGFLIALKRWTIPVFFADADTPRYRVRLKANWAPARWFKGEGGPVSPATESDGISSRADAIPEGARLQLDPTLDLDSLGLSSYERIIAVAMQQYGLILADHGGGFRRCHIGDTLASMSDEQTQNVAGIPPSSNDDRDPFDTGVDDAACWF